MSYDGSNFAVETQVDHSTTAALLVNHGSEKERFLKETLKSLGFRVKSCRAVKDAASLVEKNDYSIVLAGTDKSGSIDDFLEACCVSSPRCRVILISETPDIDSAVSFIKKGGYEYLPYPIEKTTLRKKISDALESRQRIIDDEMAATAEFDNDTLADYKLVQQLKNSPQTSVSLVEKDGKMLILKKFTVTRGPGKNTAEADRILGIARKLSDMNHPYIAGFTDFGYIPQRPDQVFSVREYIDGEPLSSYIGHNTLSMAQKAEIIRECADALATIHNNGIIHRDIKPGNIMLERSSRKVKIIDFGIARIGDVTQKELESSGTPAYMAPERMRTPPVSMKASDVFSLGVLSYELLTGIKPFYGETFTEIRRAIKNAKALEPSKICADISPEIQSLVGFMLRKAPEDRPSAKDILLALDAVCEGKKSAGKLMDKLRIPADKTFWQ